MNVIFRRNISSIILIILVVIIISCPSIQTDEEVVIYSSVLNNSFQNVKAIGAYANGTILFKFKKHHEDNLYLIHFDGNQELVKNIKKCKPVNSCNYELLNPNHVITYYTKDDTSVGTIIDWYGNIILNFKFNLLSINQNNDRFLIMKHKNQFTEYHFDNNETITHNLQFSKRAKGHKITKIFSLYNAWGIKSVAKGKTFFSIIQTNSKNRTLKVKKLEDFKDKFNCITNNQTNNIQYYCMYRTLHNHRLKLVNINNLSYDNTFNLISTELFPDISFGSQTHIHIIPNVGFLVESTENLKTKYYIFNIFEINYFDPNNAFGEWIVDNNFIGNNLFILPNNTIVQIRKNKKSIKFVQIDLVSRKIPKNNPYDNTHIKKVYPSINDLINIGTNKLNITFLNPIDPTTAVSISIYYINNDNENILRQKFLCTSPTNCIISDDNYSLTINLSEITFNMLDASYYVEIDDNFVKYKNEPSISIPGIKPNKWIIKTSPGLQDAKIDANFILGKLRLNSSESEQFRRLTHKDDFFDKMSIELSKSIPIDRSRIKKIKYNDEYDKISGEVVKFATFLFEIDPPKEDNFNKKSTEEVFKDLNSLITTKDYISNLDNNCYTKNIDKDYGFQKLYDPLEELNISINNFMMDKRYLITVIICVILIIILYLFGRYKNKKGTNIIVFKVTLIITDIINDIRFVIKLNNLSNLFIPSIIFLLFPFILNIILAVVIFKSEMQCSKNSEWFKHYIKPVAIVTVLSSGDIELLHIFDSNFGGFRIFSAKFSSKTLNLIFWGGFLNIIVENLPQLVIQIYYAIDSSNIYDVTALFTLITSILVFLVSVIEISYHLFMKNKNENHVRIQSEYNDEAKDIK